MSGDKASYFGALNELLEKAAVVLVVAALTGTGAHLAFSDWKVTAVAFAVALGTLLAIKQGLRWADRWLEASRRRSKVLGEILSARDPDQKLLAELREEMGRSRKFRSLMGKKHQATLLLIVEIIDTQRRVVDRLRWQSQADEVRPFRDRWEPTDLDETQRELDNWRDLLNPSGGRLRGRSKQPPEVLVEVARKGFYVVTPLNGDEEERRPEPSAEEDAS